MFQAGAVMAGLVSLRCCWCCSFGARGGNGYLLQLRARSIKLNTYKSKHSFCRAKARERKGMICACCSTVLLVPFS